MRAREKTQIGGARERRGVEEVEEEEVEVVRRGGGEVEERSNSSGVRCVSGFVRQAQREASAAAAGACPRWVKPRVCARGRCRVCEVGFGFGVACVSGSSGSVSLCAPPPCVRCLWWVPDLKFAMPRSDGASCVGRHVGGWLTAGRKPGASLSDYTPKAFLS